MSFGHGHAERKRTWVHAFANVCAFVNRHTVDGDRVAWPFAGHGVSRQSDEAFDKVVAAEFAAVFLLQPVVGVFEHHYVAAFQIEDFRRKFRGDHTVARLDGIHHGSRWNHIETEKENTYQKYDDNRNSAPDQGVAPAKAFAAIVFFFGMLHT